MPYKNMPKSKWPAMERCVADVKKKGDVDNVYAVCYASVMKESVAEFVDRLVDEEGVDEITVAGNIAVIPMGMGKQDSDERTPKDISKVKTPANINPGDPNSPSSDKSEAVIEATDAACLSCGTEVEEGDLRGSRLCRNCWRELEGDFDAGKV